MNTCVGVCGEIYRMCSGEIIYSTEATETHGLIFLAKRGKERVGVVKKTRIETFLDNETFPFSYDEIAKRYGKEILEKESEVEVLATHEQVTELNRLIDLLKIPEETTEKWLKKFDSEQIDEMKSENIQKIIDHLTKQLTGEK